MEFVEYSAGMCLSKNKTTKQNKSKKKKKKQTKMSIAKTNATKCESKKKYMI